MMWEDQRVQRSKRLLQQALMELVGEKTFDKITVQDILERAQVGRTTFYTYFQSKEDLFLSNHGHLIEMIVDSFLAEDGTLHTAPSTALITVIKAMAQQDRDTFFNLTWGNEAGEIMRLLKERLAEQFVQRLHRAFSEEKSRVAFAMLAQHVANSVVSLSNWWLAKRTLYTAEELLMALHQMNCAAIRDALSLNNQ